MKRAVFLFLFVCPVSIAATRVVVPVASATYKDRVYTTTVALKNSSAVPVPCSIVYTPVNRKDSLTSSDVVPAGQTLVMQDFLKMIGAVGSATIDCSGEVLVAVRLQDSFDDGTTFRTGRVFAGLTTTPVITESHPETITTQSDIALVDISGKHSTLSVQVTNAAGAIIGEKVYDMPPRTFQIVNLEKLIGHGDMHVRIAAKGPGRIVFARATTDPAMTRITMRMPQSNKFVPQRQTQSQAGAINPLSMIAPLSPFKAAAFQDPMTGLILMRNRWYDPRTGTFITPDPMKYQDSPNLDAYCAGDPVNCSDPTPA